MPEAPAMLDAMGPAVQDSAVANAKRELAGGNALPQQSAAKLIPKNSRPHALARVPDRFKRRQNDFSSRSECARLPAFPASLRLDVSSRDLAPRACVTGYAVARDAAGSCSDSTGGFDDVCMPNRVGGHCIRL